jgi:hypothetical protein
MHMMTWPILVTITPGVLQMAIRPAAAGPARAPPAVDPTVASEHERS